MLVYLVAGEPSGDMLGARLMRALKQLDPKIQFAGVGGDNMEKEGLRSLFDITDLSIMGLIEVIPSIPKVLRHIKETVADIMQKKPDVVITIDSWSFSARVHKAIRRQNIKLLQMHYVAPQVWAWKKGRAKTMHKYIDHLLTLFPQEPDYFTPYHLPTDFVGHPAIESSMLTTDTHQFLQKYKIDENEKVVLLLPGSRHNEVERLLPVFLEAKTLLQKKHPELVFVLPTVKTVEKHVRDILGTEHSDILVLNNQEERYAAIKSAKAAIAASGTVALELAIVNVPHLVAYKVPYLTAWIARHFTNIKYINLTNILLDKAIVPEILQEDCNAQKLCDVAEELLNSESELFKYEREEFEKLRRLLGMGKQYPSLRAAEIVLKCVKEFKSK